MRTKYQESKRTYSRFCSKNESWLNVEFHFDNPTNTQLEPVTPSTSSEISKRGRPSLSFSESSERSKRRRAQDIREQHSAEELAYATQMSLRARGNIDAAKVVQDVSEGSPTKAKAYRASLCDDRERQMTKEEALSLFVENKMSQSMYNNIRANSIKHNCKLYLSYKCVLQAKKECYPPASDMCITESSAEVKLQSLLDHTTQRILLVQNDVVSSLTKNDALSLTLMCKWGLDGTSGQSNFKQKFQSDTDKSDSSIFFTSLVPLQILYLDESTGEQKIVWKKPRTSSTRFYRPIKIEFLHETVENTKHQVDYIVEQQQNLIPYETIVDGKQVTVTYKLALTMVDGKVCNSLTDTSSSQRCYICQCTSKQFNNIDEILKKPIKEENLQFGISSLHAWIRFFECLLHVSYKLEVKKWQNRGEDKDKIQNRKQNIQKGFRQQLGLLIDMPKQGFGSTNDGNTARRFFENSKISATITGINEDLLKRFHIILQVISSGFEIDVPKYKEYCLETARLFVELYPWFYMPTTVHKLLIHSAQIIESSLLPIGQMSEEAQESCNKLIKKYRQDFARKTSRIENMQDVFLRLLVSSDPLISGVRKLPIRKFKALDPQAIELLKPPSINSQIEFPICQSSSEEGGEQSDSEY